MKSFAPRAAADKTAAQPASKGPAMADNRAATTKQRQAQADIAASPRQQARQQQALGSPTPLRPNRTGLPDKLKAGVESLSGHSLDDVQVHYNSAKPAQLQAHAYAQGTDIHVGPGQEKHLPHEAWHVVQQKQGRVRATRQMKGVAVNDENRLEKEADVMGAQANRLSNNVLRRTTGIVTSITPPNNNATQLKMEFDAKVKIYDIEELHSIGVDIPHIYLAQQIKAKSLVERREQAEKKEIILAVRESESPKYVPTPGFSDGTIWIPAVKKTDITEMTSAGNSALAAMAHETQHAIDDLNDDLPNKLSMRPSKNESINKQVNETLIYSEWRAWCLEALVNYEQKKKGVKMPDFKALKMQGYFSIEEFKNPDGQVFVTTKHYLSAYKVIPDATDEQTKKWMESKLQWIQIVVKEFHRLKAKLDETYKGNMKEKSASPIAAKPVEASASSKQSIPDFLTGS